MRDKGGESYILHSPENLRPAAANSMRFGKRELTGVGRWPSPSKMPERADRSARASELTLRNTITPKMIGDWEMVPVYRVPSTVIDSARIGKSIPNGTGVAPACDRIGNRLLGAQIIHRMSAWRGRHLTRTPTPPRQLQMRIAPSRQRAMRRIPRNVKLAAPLLRRWVIPALGLPN